MKKGIKNPKGFNDIYSSAAGIDIWDFLNTEEIWFRLELTTQLGHPAAEGVGDKLLEKFGIVVKEDRMKQAIGHMIRPIMEANGYTLEKQGVPCRKKKEVFVYASRYKKG